MKLLMFMSCLCLAFLGALAQNNTAMISGKIDKTIGKDSVTLKMYHKGYFENAPESTAIYKSAVNKDGFFIFKLSGINNPVYFDLLLGSSSLYTQLVAAGDNYMIYADSNQLKMKISGKGAIKVQVSMELANLSMKIKNRYPKNDPNFIVENFKLKDSVFLIQLALINQKKQLLGEQVYQIMLADIVAENVSKSFYITHYLKGKDAKPFLNRLKDYSDPVQLLSQIELLSNTENAAHSFDFVPNMIYKYRFDSCFMKERLYEIAKSYAYFTTHYKGALKTKFQVYLANSSKATVQEQHYTDSLLKADLDPFYKTILNRLRSRFTAGTVAYPFILKDEKGRDVALSDFKGKVILLDFWYTGCPACPQIVPHLEKIKARFFTDKFVVLSVSIDKDIIKWKQSLRGGLYSIKKSVHLYTGGQGASHPLINYYGIRAFPHVLLIDSDGLLGQVPLDPRSDGGKDLQILIEKYLNKTP